MRVIFHKRVAFVFFAFLRYALVNAVAPDSEAGMFFEAKVSVAAWEMAA